MLDITQQVLAQTYTRTQALRRVELLREVINQKVFSSDAGANLEISQQNQNWIDSLGEPFFKQFDKDSASKLLTTVEEEINNIQPLTIFVPIEFPQTEVESIVGQLRKSYGPTFLIDFKLNPLLIAGAALAWKGVYRDYSLHQRIADSHQAILTKFKEYIKTHG